MSDAAAFVFNCHRCGHCCSVGHGRVWIDAEEIDNLAAACGQQPAAFVARQVVQVGDRLSLREKSNGCCALLEDGNRCTVYAARPAQCRTFPFWPELLADPGALESAAGYCPGIQRIPAPALAAAVLPRARAVLLRHAAAPRSSLDTAGERWGTSLEADLCLAERTRAATDDACRGAAARRDLEDLAAATGYPWSVGPWERLLAERAQGWDQLHGGPPQLAAAS